MPRLWDKGQPIDDLVLRFTVGEDYLLDQRLVKYDVRASIAHAEMLGDMGHLKSETVEQLTQLLTKINLDHASGLWSISLEEEDCHTALENRLGDVGAEIHLGRSRNDQVLVALRLYLKDVIAETKESLGRVVSAFRELGESQGAVPLPGYTHLQRAMPSSVAAWSAGYASVLESNAGLLDAALALADENPLGSAAGYGTPGLKLDREETTKKLDFKTTQEPVTAAQLSRGKAEASLAFSLYQILQDLGRCASELTLFATKEFDFVTLPTEFTTGSSIMPQKRNPDVLELIRAQSAQSIGELNSILAITSKLPSGYHRDLQLLKAPLFRLIDRSLEVLAITEHLIPNLRFNREQTEAAIDPSLHAAERAFDLVQREKIPFREAYKRIAQEL